MPVDFEKDGYIPIFAPGNYDDGKCPECGEQGKAIHYTTYRL
jgi:hypothetical protein